MDGHLFQGRFGAVVMREPHLLAAARYIRALSPRLSPAGRIMVTAGDDFDPLLIARTAGAVDDAVVA